MPLLLSGNIHNRSHDMLQLRLQTPLNVWSYRRLNSSKPVPSAVPYLIHWHCLILHKKTPLKWLLWKCWFSANGEQKWKYLGRLIRMCKTDSRNSNCLLGKTTLMLLKWLNETSLKHYAVTLYEKLCKKNTRSNDLKYIKCCRKGIISVTWPHVRVFNQFLKAVIWLHAQVG